MKLQKLSFFTLKLFSVSLLMTAVLFTSCNKDDDDDEPAANPVASFQYVIDQNDFLTVNFTNFSQNATSYEWDFGDGNSSTEENPTHTYMEVGDYTVVLTATNSDGVSANKSETIAITDPDAAFKLLTGDVSKTWKLFREGTSMSLGPDKDNPALWWSGLTNDGSRPCLYEHEFTFHLDGTYEFNDNGMFWAEFGVFNNEPSGCDQNITPEQCFEATPANMFNACNEDVSAWLSGTHQFTYDVSTGELTLTGDGAWIGIPKLTTDGESRVPVSQVATKISIEEFVGYDVMLVEFEYDGAYWPIRYASYSDPSLEPELVTEKDPFGEDFPDISPTELSNAFESATSFVLLDTIVPSGSNVVYGVDDPADPMGTKVGQFNRTDAQFQELQFQTSPTKNDINFENLTKVSVDVYFPSSNDYSGGLNKMVIIGLADASATEQWWTDHQQFEFDGSAQAEDEWFTVEFQLDSPSTVANPANGATPYDRNDYDMIFLQIGGGNHTDTGTFFVRNLRFE